MTGHHRRFDRFETFETFEGEIGGFGTASGHRIVIGRWSTSPFGAFADVMQEDPDGTRTLRAPNARVAEFVQETYTFDAVQIEDVVTRRTADGLHVEAGALAADLTIGSRTLLGHALHALPPGLARSRWWCTAIDPFARLLQRGVRTRGTAGNGRHEWYGATDQHRLTAVRASLAGVDLGSIADVWPPVRFGFSSTPKTPGIVTVTTTIAEPAPRRNPGTDPRAVSISAQIWDRAAPGRPPPRRGRTR